MIRWCAYCQRYQGEVEPFDDYSMTHGICKACTERKVFLREVPSSLSSIRHFFLRVAGGALDTTASELVREGTALGLDPIDLLLGIVQPVMRQIGARWERAEATVAEEQRVTALCASVIQLLLETDTDIAALRHARQPTVLLVAAENNAHTLGMQLLDVVLLKNHISVFTVYPSLRLNDVVKLARSLRPRVVAVSAALPAQLESVVLLEERVRALPLQERPLVVVGGLALQSHPSLPTSRSLLLCRDLHSFIELAAASSTARPRADRALDASVARR